MTTRIVAALAAAFLGLAAGPAAAQTLHTNEAYVEEVTARSALDVKDPLAVFAFVLGALPDRVRVMPTENYYYFRFTHDGVPYVGNLRLAARDRDKGILHFVYGDLRADWLTEIATQRHMLDAAHGVAVEKVEDLAYRVTFRGRSVTFALNDLSKVKPPEGLLRPGEVLIGPVFDDSAIRFFLVFNTEHKVFHYLLDETGPVADAFVAVRGNASVLIGKRTGFGFYQDGNRKVLIGADERASLLNTPYDGPFDQLPENFIEGETLREAILAVEPELKGRMDRFGNIEDFNDRFLIHPYLLYRYPSDLEVFHRCLNDPRVPEANRPRCFVISDGESQKPAPQPLALVEAAAAGAKPAASEAPSVAEPPMPPPIEEPKAEEPKADEPKTEKPE